MVLYHNRYTPVSDVASCIIVNTFLVEEEYQEQNDTRVRS